MNNDSLPVRILHKIKENGTMNINIEPLDQGFIVEIREEFSTHIKTEARHAFEHWSSVALFVQKRMDEKFNKKEEKDDGKKFTGW
jgi:hypothetical protein